MQLEKSSRHQDLSQFMNEQTLSTTTRDKNQKFLPPSTRTITLISGLFHSYYSSKFGLHGQYILDLSNNFYILGDKANATQQAEKLVWAS